jgi:hypothetical protein
MRAEQPLSSRHSTKLWIAGGRHGCRRGFDEKSQLIFQNLRAQNGLVVMTRTS